MQVRNGQTDSVMKKEMHVRKGGAKQVFSKEFFSYVKRICFASSSCYHLEFLIKDAAERNLWL